LHLRTLISWEARADTGPRLVCYVLQKKWSSIIHELLRVGVLLQRRLLDGVTRRGMARMIAIKDADQVAFSARNY